MPDSTRKSRPRKADDPRPKPGEPYKGFPLSPHASGAWQKKIRGKLHYFGRWGKSINGKLVRLPGDEWWRPALELYKAQADDLHAGRTPRKVGTDGLTVKDLADRFYTAKLRKLESGELSPRSLHEYDGTCARIVKAFGRDRLVEDLDAHDFASLRASIAEQWGLVRLSNEIGRVRTIFKYGYEVGLIKQPMRFGPEFKKPERSVMRKHRARQGSRMFTADELNRLLKAASVPMKAMILLGLNCGYGNTDVADLPTSALDLDGGWIHFPRPKTGIERRCKLWPETIEALRKALDERPNPKHEEDAEAVFLTARRERWVRPTGKSRTDQVTNVFGALLRKLKINGRNGLGFYSLRHTHRTVSDGARDPVAANLIMGHADHTMASVYREHIDDARLVVVSDLVRLWLFGAVEGAGVEKAEGGES